MLGHAFIDERADRAVVQLVLGLGLELRVDELDGHDRRNPLAHVLARELVVLFEDVELPARVVDDFRERHFQSLDVRSAVNGVDVVRVAVYDFVIALVVLYRHFADGVAVRFLEIYGLGEKDLVAVFIQFLDEGADAALVTEGILLFLAGTLVFKRDAKPLIEIGELS